MLIERDARLKHLGQRNFDIEMFGNMCGACRPIAERDTPGTINKNIDLRAMGDWFLVMLIERKARLKQLGPRIFDTEMRRPSSARNDATSSPL